MSKISDDQPFYLPPPSSPHHQNDKNYNHKFNNYHNNNNSVDDGPYYSSSSSSNEYPSSSSSSSSYPYSYSGSGSGSNSGAPQVPSPGEIVSIGVAVDVFLLIVAVIIINFCRYAASSSGRSCHCTSTWSDLISTNGLHWKTNVYMLVCILLALVAIPCIWHLSSCLVFEATCTWALDLQLAASNNATNPIFDFIINKYEDATAAAASNQNISAIEEDARIVKVTLIVANSYLFAEMILSFFISLISLRWFSESNVSTYDSQYHDHMISELNVDEDIVHEWECISCMRKILFIFGIVVFSFGAAARVVVYSWLASRWLLGGGDSLVNGVMFDSFSLPELIIVVVWATFHYFSFIYFCCKRTFSEHHMMHNDYTGFVCPSCEASGGNGSSGRKCPACDGTGLKYEAQNSHYSAALV